MCMKSLRNYPFLPNQSTYDQAHVGQLAVPGEALTPTLTSTPPVRCVGAGRWLEVRGPQLVDKATCSSHLPTGVSVSEYIILVMIYNHL